MHLGYEGTSLPPIVASQSQKYVHLEPLSTRKGWRHYIARSFSTPVGDIDAKTKQPWKSYEGICVISVKDRHTGIIRALVSVPPRGLAVMRHDIAGQLRLTKLYGIRWDPVTKTKHRINIPLRSVTELTAQLKSVSPANDRVRRALQAVLDAPVPEVGEKFSSSVFIIRRNQRGADRRPIAYFFRKPEDFQQLRSLVGMAPIWNDRGRSGAS